VVLAENSRWRIKATGAPYERGSYWWGPENVSVKFEIEENGVLYASGQLYDSGPNDDSFKVEFPSVQWLTQKAIRLYKQPRGTVPTFEINLRNASNLRVKWIMLYSQDVFLFWDLEGGETINFSSLQWGPQAITVTGEWQDGTRIHKSEASLPQWTASVDVSATEGETRIDVHKR
jgi:hypothetical protein